VKNINEIGKEVINILESKNGILNPKQIRARLSKSGFNIQDKDLGYLLDKLVNKKQVLRVDRNKYRISFSLKPLIGKLDFTKRGSAYFLSEKGDDIFIHESNVGNALSNDLVEIKVTPRGKKKEGTVVRVVERANPYIVAGVMEQGGRFKIVPRGNSYFPAHQLHVDLADYKPQNSDLIKLKIDDSKKGSRINAFWVETMGKIGDNNTEMHAIVNEFGFSTDFKPDTLKEADGLSHEITKDEITKRKDLRSVLTFTIDPKTAKDFDDALSYEETREGVVVGVHIADVSHYVTPDTALNSEAAERATSVYLVDRTIPMLPEVLSNELCSLKPNVDRLAFSVLFTLSRDGQITNQEIIKTVIHSDRRLAYEDAQEIIEGKKDEKLEKAIHFCNKVALKLKKARFAHGAINFENPEVQFVLDDTGKPIGLQTKVRKDAHKMIEEWMLLANRTIAKFMKQEGGKYQAPFVYRTHDEPSYEKLVDLKTFAKKFGYTIHIDNMKSLSADINKLVQDIEGKPEEYLLNNLAIRSMAKAVYTTQKSSHFGLAFDYYCHFTSPIRRYPDLLCHRWLHRFLTNKEKGDIGTMEALAKHSSAMEQNASNAERASIKYKQAEFLQSRIGEEFAAVVSGLTEWGIYAAIPEFNAEGMIRLSDIEHGSYFYDEKNKTVNSRDGGKPIIMGSEIRVKVLDANPLDRKIDLGLVK
jgi:ribonuclease R